jgi:hypothetical protein
MIESTQLGSIQIFMSPPEFFVGLALTDAAGRHCGQAILGKPASDRERRAHQPLRRTVMFIGIVADCLLGALRYEADDDRIFEDEGAVQNLVRSSPHGRVNHGMTGLSGEHESILKGRA